VDISSAIVILFKAQTSKKTRCFQLHIAIAGIAGRWKITKRLKRVVILK